MGYEENKKRLVWHRRNKIKKIPTKTLKTKFIIQKKKKKKNYSFNALQNKNKLDSRQKWLPSHQNIVFLTSF